MQYVGLFGLSPTKYLNEDSQTLGNKKPSLHRKAAAELQPRPLPKGRLQGELRQGFDGPGCRIVLRSVDWKIDTTGMQ